MNEMEILPTEIIRRGSNEPKKQIALWFPLSDKFLYEKLNAKGVNASEHCRQAMIKVIRYLAEKEGLIQKDQQAG